MTIYKASMDSFTKIVTFLVSILLLVAGFIPLFTTFDETLTEHQPFFEPFIYFLPLGLIILLIFTYGFSPKAYAIEDRKLIILRPFGNKFYSIEEFQKISLIDKNEMKWTMRLFGVGGLFGYFGFFRNNRFGTMIWYATRRDQFVVIERTKGKTIVLTPDEPNTIREAFIL